MRGLASGLRPLLSLGPPASRGDPCTELFSPLCARASGCSWRAPALALNCSKRRKRRATGRRSSSMVSANDPGALGTADAFPDCAPSTGPLSADLSSEPDVTDSPDSHVGARDEALPLLG